MSFVALPALIGPMLGPVAGGFIVGLAHWRAIFFLNVPVGILGLHLVYRHLPDYRADRTDPLDIVGMVLFGSGVALLSYILEVFGEHTLSLAEILGLLALSAILLAGYGRHAIGAAHPLLHLGLCGIRTFRSLWLAASSPAWAPAACRFCFLCSTRWDWATAPSSRVCSSCPKL